MVNRGPELSTSAPLISLKRLHGVIKSQSDQSEMAAVPSAAPEGAVTLVIKVAYSQRSEC